MRMESAPHSMLPDLQVVYDEILAQQRELHVFADLAEIIQRTLDELLFRVYG